MIRLLQFLLHGHIHDYRILNELDITDKTGECLMKRIHFLQCATCGNIKAKKTDVNN